MSGPSFNDCHLGIIVQCNQGYVGRGEKCHVRLQYYWLKSMGHIISEIMLPCFGVLSECCTSDLYTIIFLSTDINLKMGSFMSTPLSGVLNSRKSLHL